MFALVVYGTIIFPQSPEYVNSPIVDLIEQIDYLVFDLWIIVEEKAKGALLVVRNCCTFEFEVIFGANVKRRFRFCMFNVVPIEEFCKKEWPKD